MLIGKLAVIEEFARDARLTTKLKNELRDAIQYSTERTSLSWEDKQSLLSELPKKLRYEVALAMHQSAAKSLLFFEGKDPVFISAIVPFMQPMFVRAKEMIFEQGEYADEIYFIVSGRVSFVLEEGGFVYRTLQQGAYFGDIEVIQVIPRKYSVAAAADSNLLTLKKPLLDIVQSDFPIYWEEMKTLAEARDQVNENAKKEFLGLLALKKAGQLDKADPKGVRDKLRRVSASRPLAEENIPVESDTDSLHSYVKSSLDTITALKTDAAALKRTAAEIIRLLTEGPKGKLPHGPPLSLEEKVRQHVKGDVC